ncbi:hypothetical protein [Pseudomonas sp. ML2-2023-6]|uniref:hypothetical protein n=1 Tax=Pseudomonas sp. ML2-2023-6 TaxID=3122376 RepID=UPI0030CC9EA1
MTISVSASHARNLSSKHSLHTEHTKEQNSPDGLFLYLKLILLITGFVFAKPCISENKWYYIYKEGKLLKTNNKIGELT